MSFVDGESDGSGKRGSWEFPYKASKVLDGARVKALFHAGRVSFWEAKKEETIGKIKAEGLEFDESLSDITSNYDRQSSVSVRNDLLKDLRECNVRLTHNRERLKGYETWVEVLGAAGGDTTLQLRHEDYLFFFGTKGDGKST